MSRSMVEPRIAGRTRDATGDVGAPAPRPDTMVQAYARAKDKEVTLLLDAEAWVLVAPGRVIRQPLDASPAVHLSQLDASSLARGAGIRVVFGDGWLRHLVVEWPAGVSSRAECEAYLGLRFREVHGIASPEWQFALDCDSVTRRVLACAVPVALVSAVQAFVRQHRLRLVGMSGDFVTQYNHLHRRFKEPKGVLGALAIARGARLMLGLWRDGQWLAIRSLPISDGEVGVTVARALEAWSFAHASGAPPKGVPAGVLYGVGTVGASGVESALPSAWKIERCGGAT